MTRNIVPEDYPLLRSDRNSVAAIRPAHCEVTLALGAACFIGLTVPSVLHASKCDPKIAAGPLTLALTDIFTLLFYFTLAAVLL